MKRFKIIEDSNGSCRFSIQAKKMFFWKTLGIQFESIKDAEDHIHKISNFDYNPIRTYHPKIIKEIVIY